MFILRTKSILQTFFRHHHLYIDHFDLSSTGISLKEFHQRRHALVHLIRNFLKTQSKDFTICLPASTRLFIGPDVMCLPFKQQADFYYLTGCMQPDAVFVVNGNNQKFSTNLFLPSFTTDSIGDYERWFGETMTDKDQICQLFGIDRVYPTNKLPTFNIPSSSVLFYDLETMDSTSINRKNLIPFLSRFSSSTVCNQLNQFLHALRVNKSTTEQNLIRQACQLTSKAFIQTMKKCKTDTPNENIIKSRFQYECQILDDTSMAFYPVVAAHGRSNIIHYQKNNQSINRNDLIMLDGGCLYKQYSSDITRLWPINGRFSSPYRQLYEILLTVQKDVMQYLNSREKTITRQQLNTLTDQYMIKYLREELILSRNLDDHQAGRIVDFLSPTSVSHHLGLDVHDCESISFSRPLQPGNVITIEPGLYIPWNYPDVPSIYRGFASRLEDDVLITEQGCEILSHRCPKEIEDLYRILDQREQ